MTRSSRYESLKELMLATVILMVTAQPVAAQTRLIPSQDMTYSGAFKLPDPGSGYFWNLWGDPAGYNYGGMTVYPPNGSLLIMGGPGGSSATDKYIAEVGIPLLVMGDYGSLNTGTLNPGGWSNDFTDLTPSQDLQLQYCQLGDIHYFTKQGTQDTDKLYITHRVSYNSNNCDSFFDGPFAWTETNLDNLDLQGFWNLDSKHPNWWLYVGKYLFHAPALWADQHVGGKYLIAGYYRGGGSQLLGPTLYAFAPWEHCAGDCDSNPPSNGTAMDAEILLEYGAYGDPFDNGLDGTSPQDRFNDAVWLTVGNKSAAVIYAYRCARAAADYRWSYGTHPVYASKQGSSYYSGSGRPVLLFYDPDDLADVAAGTANAHDPQPYAVMDLSPYFYSGVSSSASYVNGMAYDEASGKVYLAEITGGDATDYQAIHVFSLSDTGSALDTEPPSVPALSVVSATREQVQLSWTASTDDSGCVVVYELYKNDIPFRYTTDTTHTDAAMAYMHSPVEYHLIARDSTGNETQSNSVYVDDDDGGNAPLNVFIPALGPFGTAHHETSYGLTMIPGQSYSMTPTALGGAQPYAWSLSADPGPLPGDMQIDSSTGEITCTNHANDTWYRGTVTLQDSNGSMHKRLVSWRSMSSSDRDGDGYSAGAGDNDDTTVNIHPGNPGQPPPTNLQGSAAGSVASLSWTAAAQRQDTHSDIYYRRFEGEITYEVHHGTSPGVYTDSAYVGRATSHTFSGLPFGDHYFAVTAYAFRGLESAYSNEVRVTSSADPPPAAPGNLRVMDAHQIKSLNSAGGEHGSQEPEEGIRFVAGSSTAAECCRDKGSHHHRGGGPAGCGAVTGCRASG